MLRAKMGGVTPLKASLRLGDDVQSKWLGDWQVGRSYVPLDKVNRGGSSFVCIRPCTAVDPMADVGDGVEGQYWILIAKKGKDGKAGADFTYDMFTEEQLEALKGRPFTYADFTKEQLDALRGPAGETITDISRTAGNGAPGTIDTYTVTTNTGRTWPLYLYNGKDGAGAGDMTAEVYDPQGKATDIFEYVDEKLKDVDFDVTADKVTFADGQTFQQKYDSGDLTGPAGPQGPAGQNGQPGEQGPAGANGQPGAAGKDATINGVNALTIAGNGGVAATQSGNTLNLSVSGTFAGQAVANSSGQTPGTSLLRNSKLVSADTDPTVNGEINWTYG